MPGGARGCRQEGWHRDTPVPCLPTSSPRLSGRPLGPRPPPGTASLSRLPAGSPAGPGSTPQSRGASRAPPDPHPVRRKARAGRRQGRTPSPSRPAPPSRRPGARELGPGLPSRLPGAPGGRRARSPLLGWGWWGAGKGSGRPGVPPRSPIGLTAIPAPEAPRLPAPAPPSWPRGPLPPRVRDSGRRVPTCSAAAAALDCRLRPGQMCAAGWGERRGGWWAWPCK